MATRMTDDEGWEDLTLDELSSTDPGVVVRIQDLLSAARGHPGQNREGPVRQALLRVSREPLERRPVLSSTEALVDYLTVSLGHCPRETAHVLYLNAGNPYAG